MSWSRSSIPRRIALALLSQNRLQAVLGGLSAGYFNALEKGLPITIGLSRVSTPIAHYLMLRSDLKDQVKEIKQLKGRTIATNGPGSVSTYEIGKILETAGLTLADVDIKVIPFAQYAIAFTNKAIDAALAIAPWTWQLPKQGIALPFGDSDALIRPTPVSISVAMINTDWAKTKANLPRDFFLGYLRGVRDYCQAYHGGSPRKQIIDLLIRSGTETRLELLNEYVWPARDPFGRINSRQHARHAGLVRPQQVHRRPLSGRAAGRSGLRRICGAEARPVRAREGGQQARRLPVTGRGCPGAQRSSDRFAIAPRCTAYRDTPRARSFLSPHRRLRWL